MRKIILIFFFSFILFSESSYAKLSSKNNNAIAKLCKVWGYMKYYHPDVYAGKYDWDKELFKILPKFINLSSYDNTEDIILQWVNSYELNDEHPIVKLDSANVDIFIDLKWIECIKNPELRKYLNRLSNLKRNTNSHYVRYDPSYVPIFNEPEYDLKYIHDINYRLLFLFKAWNVIEYFNPYKHILDKKWDDVLVELIPNFIMADNLNTFMEICCQPLKVALSDNHVNIRFKDGKSPLPITYKGFTPKLKFVEDKLVIIDIDTSHAAYTKMQKGDIIYKVNDKKISYYKNKYNREFSNSSDAGLKFSIYNTILTSADSILTISYLRKGVKFYSSINIKDMEDISKYPKDRIKSYSYIKDTILYIIPCKIKKEDDANILEAIKLSKKIIIDIRNEPIGVYNIISDAITSNNETFAMVQMPYISYSGNFINKIGMSTQNKNIFAGKIVVITDENAISHSEFTIMKLQKAKNCVTIGEKTMGVDGNARNIDLPFNLRLSFTTIGIYYPDGGETQRVGVKIDEIVKPTIKGVREGRDEVLERAIEIITIDGVEIKTPKSPLKN